MAHRRASRAEPVFIPSTCANSHQGWAGRYPPHAYRALVATLATTACLLTLLGCGGAAQRGTATHPGQDDRSASVKAEDRPGAPSANLGKKTPPPAFNPKRLIGLGKHQIEQLLGKPAFVRRDKPAELWRYRDETCVLDLYLYRPVSQAGEEAIVRHFEVRRPAGGHTGARACLARLVKRVGDGTTG